MIHLLALVESIHISYMRFKSKCNLSERIKYSKIGIRSDRIEVLDAIQAAGLRTLRLFISYTPADNKATGSVLMPDIEPQIVGTYDNTQLEAIDQLMVEAHERGK